MDEELPRREKRVRKILIYNGKRELPWSTWVDLERKLILPRPIRLAFDALNSVKETKADCEHYKQNEGLDELLQRYKVSRRSFMGLTTLFRQRFLNWEALYAPILYDLALIEQDWPEKSAVKDVNGELRELSNGLEFASELYRLDPGLPVIITAQDYDPQVGLQYGNIRLKIPLVQQEIQPIPEGFSGVNVVGVLRRGASGDLELPGLSLTSIVKGYARTDNVIPQKPKR